MYITIAIIFSLVAFLWYIARHKSRRNGRSLSSMYGDWAVITGASAGLGEAYAEQLAAQNFNLVIVARREEQLKALSERIRKSNPKVQVKIIVADLATTEGVEETVKGVNGIDIGILINNAGIGYIGYVADQDPTRLASMSFLNCTSPVLLTRKLLPAMLQRKRGAIVFVSSIAGWQPIPCHSLYAATKAYLSIFGASLAEEVKDKGIDVLTVEPGTFVSEFQASAGEVAHHGINASDVASRSLTAIGERSSIAVGTTLSILKSAVAYYLPRHFIAPIAKKRTEKLMPKTKQQ